MSEATPLSGAVALVTGSSRNLGAVIAAELAGRGARVVLTYRDDAEAAGRVRDGLHVAGEPHLVLRADLSTMAGAEALGQQALELAGRVDVLVNNAGPFEMTPFADLPAERFQSVWAANVGAVAALARVLAPSMRTAGKGRIVNVSAGSAYIRNHSIYTLAKAALVTLTEQLAVELGPEITVNAVAPGQIADSADEVAEIDPSFVERAIAATPLRRLVTRAEVAAIIAELCTPTFDSVTGVTIPIDGGWRLPTF